MIDDLKLSRVLAHMESLKDTGHIGVNDLDFLLDALKEKQDIIDSYEDKIKDENKVMAKIKSIMTSALVHLNRPEYKGPGGAVKIVQRTQVKMPQTPEQKDALWAWMRERGIYDRYATVHAVSLLSLYKSELEIAQQEQGEDFDPVTFALPGMEPATIFEDLKFTKTK